MWRPRKWEPGYTKSSEWIDNAGTCSDSDRLVLETVTYVSNIYKYYVAYKLVLEDEEERRKTREKVKKDVRG